MSKSPDAFRTISEVAEWLGIPAHVLRFWESKFTQIKPVKRAGGRRYYRPADMKLLGGIKHLLHDKGKSIKEVQALLRDHGVGHVSDCSASLDDSAEPIPFVDTKEPADDFASSSASVSPQMQMDLSAQEHLADSVPVAEPETQTEIEGEPQIEVLELTPAADQPSEDAVDPIAAETTQLKISVVEVEDTADDALKISHAGILAQLVGVTSLAESSMDEALICAEQLRVFTGSQNNMAAN